MSIGCASVYNILDVEVQDQDGVRYEFFDVITIKIILELDEQIF